MFQLACINKTGKCTNSRVSIKTHNLKRKLPEQIPSANIGRQIGGSNFWPWKFSWRGGEIKSPMNGLVHGRKQHNKYTALRVWPRWLAKYMSSVWATGHTSTAIIALYSRHTFVDLHSAHVSVSILYCDMSGQTARCVQRKSWQRQQAQRRMTRRYRPLN